jgi:hypothetical protein
MAFLQGTFDPEGAEFIQAALERMYQRLHEQDDPRTPAQQRADALVDICRLWPMARIAARIDRM